MTKKFLLLTVFLFVYKIVDAQHIKIDNSVLVSSYTNNKDLPILYDKLNTYSISLGADYFDRKWFYLSSQIGYVKIGGKEDFYDIKPQESAHIQLNTTFRVYKDHLGLRAFVGVGPYLNILASSSKFDTPIYRNDYDKKTYVGGKGEAGLTYDINKFRIGLIGTYMLSLTPTASSVALDLKNNNWGGTISVGYLLRK